MSYYPPSEHKHIALIGNTGAGKSSLVNMIAGYYATKVGDSPSPETQINKPCRVLETEIYIWDTPGLGESPAKDAEHTENIKELLGRKSFKGFPRINVIALVVEFHRRDVGTVISILNNIIVPSAFAGRLVLILNQVDASKNRQCFFDDSGSVNFECLSRFESEAKKLKERIESSTSVKIDDFVLTSAQFGYASQDLLDFFRAER